MPDMKQVHSSHVNAIGYDSKQRELHVQFNGGSTVKYKDVPADKARTVMNSASIGKALHEHIRNQHDHEGF